MEGLGSFVILAHAHLAGLPDHEDLMFLFPLLPALLIGTIVVATVLESRGLIPKVEPVRVTVALNAIAVAISLGAAAIHFAVIDEHLDYLPFGLAFLGLGIFQSVWALLYLRRRTPLVAWVGAVVNFGTICVWIVSRTSGLPIGPTPGVPEAIGAPDLFATALEITLIGVLLPAIVPRRVAQLAAARMPIQQAFVLAAFTIVTVALLTGLALLTPASTIAAP